MTKTQPVYTYSQPTSQQSLDNALTIKSKKKNTTTKIPQKIVKSGSLIIEPIAQHNQLVAIYQVSTYTGCLGQIAMTNVGTWTNSVDNKIYSTPYEAAVALVVTNKVDCGGNGNVPN
jgi:hypothetical protein